METREKDWAKTLEKKTPAQELKEAWARLNPKPTFGIREIDGKPAVEVGMKFSF